VNGGVIGYTSLHGLEWFRRDLIALDPDIVTLYYGWNDLWREKDSAIREWFRRSVRDERAVVRSYLWEALSRTLTFLRNRADPGEVPIQISPERYRQILERFVTLGVERGFLPVLVTAPSGFRDGETPAWLVEKGFVARTDSAPELRRRYNRVVSDVAEQHSVPLADCAAAFDQEGGRALFERPDEDPIHPSDAGYRKIAEVLAQTIVSSYASTPAAVSR
jgi:lysophospholipase L1-like esterase